MKEIEATNKERFASHMRNIARSDGMNLVEAIASYCDETGMPMEDVIPLLDNNIREEIRVDAIQHRYIRGVRKVRTLF